MQVLPAGHEALLVELSLPAEVPLLYADLRRDLACADLVPGARTVLLDGVADLDTARDYLARWAPAGGSADGVGPLVELPTTYAGAELTVAFVGFAPGFAYCTGLPPELSVPRLDRPRARVPAGAVGLAGEYTGVYPTASPGGWRLVGRTDARLWDTDRDEPALLTPGTRVRFVE